MLYSLVSVFAVLSLVCGSSLSVEIEGSCVQVSDNIGQTSVFDLNNAADYARLREVLATDQLLYPPPDTGSIVEIMFQSEFSFYKGSRDLIAESFIINLDLGEIVSEMPQIEKLKVLEVIFQKTDDVEVHERAYAKLAPEISDLHAFLTELNRYSLLRVAEYVAVKATDPQALIDFVLQKYDRPEWLRPHKKLLADADVSTSNRYLKMAVEKGHIETVKFLVNEARFNVNFDVDGDRQNLLHILPSYASQELVAFLLENIGNLLATDSKGETFLLKWTRNMHPLYFFQVLVSSPHVSAKYLKDLINAKNNFQITPLALALMQKRYELIVFLLHNGATAGIEVPIREPVRNLHKNLQRIAPVTPFAESQIARPPLDYAIYTKDALAVKILLNEYPGIFNQRNSYKQTALDVALIHGTPLFVQWIQESGKVAALV